MSLSWSDLSLRCSEIRSVNTCVADFRPLLQHLRSSWWERTLTLARSSTSRHVWARSERSCWTTRASRPSGTTTWSHSAMTRTPFPSSARPSSERSTTSRYIKGSKQETTSTFLPQLSGEKTSFLHRSRVSPSWASWCQIATWSWSGGCSWRGPGSPQSSPSSGTANFCSSSRRVSCSWRRLSCPTPSTSSVKPVSPRGKLSWECLKSYLDF